jgi:aspartate/methionine/tyrosine aminotransferase
LNETNDFLSLSTTTKLKMPSKNRSESKSRSLRDLDYMGMVWVIAQAENQGFKPSDPEWCNFGKGQPETGQLEGGPARIRSVNVHDEDFGYGPVNGTQEMREAVANHYNNLYRDGRKPYTAANVAIAQGGRLMLSRLFKALQGRLGYQTPDYAGYQDLMDNAHKDLELVHVPTDEETGFAVPPEQFEEVAQDLDAFICSNPCNPTGYVIEGEELESYCETARSTGCSLVMDEFYSHFIYKDQDEDCGPVSAAAHVEDPDVDPILIIDGMTKCFRYPGWRLAWILGPPEFIDIIGCVGSGLDGGPSTVSQRMALSALKSNYMMAETEVLRRTFVIKRDMMISRLEALGMRCLPCNGTFYVWCCLENLPTPLNTCMGFFEAGLGKKIIVGPGKFFDINPGKQRKGVSRFDNWVRFSFGPSYENIDYGLSRVEELCSEHGVRVVRTVPNFVEHAGKKVANASLPRLPGSVDDGTCAVDEVSDDDMEAEVITC